MRVLRLRCDVKPDALRLALDSLDAVAVRPGLAESMEEFELAHHLAKASFEKKRNIARNMRIEFLLWLSGKTDIRSAILEATPRSGDGEFFVAVFSDTDIEAVCRKLEAKKLPLSLRNEGEPLALERISLSRVKN
ncbi:MAG: hypothetical protein V1861_06545 [Candidatus Micrarchaeota archaeon]